LLQPFQNLLPAAVDYLGDPHLLQLSDIQALSQHFLHRACGTKSYPPF
jgi:hypothetical protein